MNYDTEQAVSLIAVAIDALKALKTEAKAASDALVPLAAENAELQAVVDGLVDADKKVDLKLAELAAELAPAPAVEPESEPVVEPTE